MAVTGGREYASNTIFSHTQMQMAADAQNVIVRDGFGSNFPSRVAAGLGGFATVLGLVFVTSTPTGIAAGVTGIISALFPSRVDTLESMCSRGVSELYYWEKYMRDRPQYSQFEIELPYIEYTVDGKVIRFVTGRGILKRVRPAGGSGWITP